jgi:hypothetical protein
MRPVCSWCQQPMDDQGDILPGEETAPGICAVCNKQQMADLDAIPTTPFDETVCSHGVPGTEFCTGCEAEV